jgi:hypothetical protein
MSVGVNKQGTKVGAVLMKEGRKVSGVAKCEVRSRGKRTQSKKKKEKKVQ